MAIINIVKTVRPNELVKFYPEDEAVLAPLREQAAKASAKPGYLFKGAYLEDALTLIKFNVWESKETFEASREPADFGKESLFEYVKKNNISVVGNAPIILELEDIPETYVNAKFDESQPYFDEIAKW